MSVSFDSLPTVLETIKTVPETLIVSDEPGIKQKLMFDLWWQHMWSQWDFHSENILYMCECAREYEDSKQEISFFFFVCSHIIDAAGKVIQDTVQFQSQGSMLACLIFRIQSLNSYRHTQHIVLDLCICFCLSGFTKSCEAVSPWVCSLAIWPQTYVYVLCSIYINPDRSVGISEPVYYSMKQSTNTLSVINTCSFIYSRPYTHRPSVAAHEKNLKFLWCADKEILVFPPSTAFKVMISVKSIS